MLYWVFMVDFTRFISDCLPESGAYHLGENGDALESHIDGCWGRSGAARLVSDSWKACRSEASREKRVLIPRTVLGHLVQTDSPCARGFHVWVPTTYRPRTVIVRSSISQNLPNTERGYSFLRRSVRGNRAILGQGRLRSPEIRWGSLHETLICALRLSTGVLCTGSCSRLEKV